MRHTRYSTAVFPRWVGLIFTYFCENDSPSYTIESNLFMIYFKRKT